MSFDEAVLDDEDALAARDGGRLLWSLATAGAQVRRAAESVADFGIERLRGDRPPRSLLVASDVDGVDAALTRFSAAGTAALPWGDAELPLWAGSADALLVGSVDGHSRRLAELAAQGAQRGLATAVVAPPSSEVASAAGRSPLHELPTGLNRHAARWSLLAPLLQALDVMAVAAMPATLLVETADALDRQAETCRPSAEMFTNAAKSLAVDFADSVPVIAGAGALAGVAATTIANALGSVAGTAAVAARLPIDTDRAVTVLRGTEDGGDSDDFFRDRVEDASGRLRPHLLVFGDDGTPDDPLLGDQSHASLQLDELPARRAAALLRDTASARGLRATSIDVPPGEPLERYASATSFGDFVAAYLALGLGVELTEVLP